MDNIIPPLPVAAAVESFFNWLEDTLGAFFEFISMVLEACFSWVSGVLTGPPALVIILIAGLLALLARGWKFALFTLLAFAFVASMGMWTYTMQTLAVVLIATVIAVAVAVPVGLLAARKNTVSTVVRPVLDFMQTLPPFVYLVPAVVLFSIGAVPGLIATIVFAMPPGVRLTELGVRQVDKEMVEAGEAFGARPRQILARIQVPLALPSIMAGVNQVIMLSLSMVVLAGIVGTPGLGAQIFTAVATVNTGLGFEAGFSVVITAIFLDRMTAVFGARGRGGDRPLISRLVSGFKPSRSQAT